MLEPSRLSEISRTSWKWSVAVTRTLATSLAWKGAQGPGTAADRGRRLVLPHHVCLCVVLTVLVTLLPLHWYTGNRGVEQADPDLWRGTGVVKGNKQQTTSASCAR